ncbi:hypothetical protein RA2_04092 [Roseovarius sp. A-2]|uniref:hypothetical protein n=1 Tax=Roseovarius sp. A-2 TaxID=1570360 RepID=UPI0009B52216|nr:hypothetical protein [Roseovarius sp. A-2]GAW37017.1 hypothetical protein RA2_04092 [Roseovarius sp. A-2]
MTDDPTPEQIKAFLDDLARISLRHGVVIEDWEEAEGLFAAIRPMEDEFRGYRSVPADDVIWIGARWSGSSVKGDCESIDLTQLSAHERLEIMGGRS